MAAKTKRPATPRSRVAKTQINKGFWFKPWMAVVLVLIVVLAGYAIVRYGHALSVNAPITVDKQAQLQASWQACEAAAGDDVENWPHFPDPHGARLTYGDTRQDACMRYAKTWIHIVLDDQQMSTTDGEWNNFVSNRVRIAQQAIAEQISLIRATDPNRNTIISNYQALSMFDYSPDGRDYTLGQSGNLNAATWRWINMFTYLYLSVGK